MIKCIGCIIYDRQKDMFLLQQRVNTTSIKMGIMGVES